MSFLPIITIFFFKNGCHDYLYVITFSKIRSSTYLSFSRQLNRKRYLTSFLPIITIYFQKTDIAIIFMGQLSFNIIFHFYICLFHVASFLFLNIGLPFFLMSSLHSNFLFIYTIHPLFSCLSKYLRFSLNKQLTLTLLLSQR